MTQSILTIECSHANKRKLMNWLAPTGVNLTQVDNGKDALIALKHLQPELILLLSMPAEVSSNKLIRELKENAPLAQLIVIASAEDNTLHNADLTRWVDDFLTEPKCQEELISNIVHLLQVQHAKQENSYLKEELAFTALVANEP